MRPWSLSWTWQSLDLNPTSLTPNPYNPKSTPPLPLPLLIWEPRHRARTVRGPPCQVLQDHSAWDLQEIERGLLSPRYLRATWDLMTIIGINMSPPGTMWEKFHQHMVTSTVSFLLVWTNPTTAISKKWHLNHAEKWSFFLDFKKLSRKLYHNFSLSGDSFFSLECFQMRNSQTITEANIYWTLTMGQALCHVVSLNLLLLF